MAMNAVVVVQSPSPVVGASSGTLVSAAGSDVVLSEAASVLRLVAALVSFVDVASSTGCSVAAKYR